METSWYSKEELKTLDLKSCGENVLLSRKTSIYNPEKISIGNNVRIDDYCILSGNISIGSYVHIGAYCGLFGGRGIIIKDYAGLSSRVTIYSESDDFSGNHLGGPVMPKHLTNVTGGEIVLNKHVAIGTGSVVLPNVIIGDGAAIGAMSLVTKSLEPWNIYFGIPVKRLKKRNQKILLMEKELS